MIILTHITLDSETYVEMCIFSPVHLLTVVMVGIFLVFVGHDLILLLLEFYFLVDTNMLFNMNVEMCNLCNVQLFFFVV